MHTHVSTTEREPITAIVMTAQKKHWQTDTFHSGYLQEYGCRNDSQNRCMNKKSTPTSVKVSTRYLLAQVTGSYKNPSIVQPVSHLHKPSFPFPDIARWSSWHLVYLLRLRSIPCLLEGMFVFGGNYHMQNKIPKEIYKACMNQEPLQRMHLTKRVFFLSPSLQNEWTINFSVSLN